MKSYSNHRLFIPFLLFVSLIVPGCDEGGGGTAPSMDQLASQIDQQKQADAAAKAAAEAKAAKGAAAQQAAAEAATRQAEEEAARQAAAAAAPPGGTTAGAATVGQGGGYYSAIVAAHRHITTRVDDLAWTQALQHYKATTGEMPKNQEEFMRIMSEGGIPLPELEQGQDYFWDPSEGDWGTLYIVEQPQRGETPPAQ